jgi:type VI secretion system secreted protein VgrG
MSDSWVQTNHPLAVTTPLGTDHFILTRCSGEERISDPFLYRLEMFSTDRDADLSSLIGQSATVAFSLDNDSQRYINGVLGKCALTRANSLDEVAFYEAELYPWFWMLNFRADCRIFQNMTTVEIIQKVFSDAGHSSDYKTSLTGTYTAREYCVQYRESDFNFVSRLMEEEGIFYFFEHSDGSHIMVLGDDSSAFSDCPNYSTLKYRANVLKHEIEDGIVYELQLEQQVYAGGYGLDDYYFITPSTSLTASASGQGVGGTINDYPGRYIDSSGGDHFTDVRLKALEVEGGVTVMGEGHCRSVCPGYKVTFSDHVRTSLNATFVLKSARIDGSKDHFNTFFTGFPSATPFRPLVRARKPIIASTQTAKVVGPSGEEIYTDQYGRVKVQFHWDHVGQNDENSSCWIRVAQGWAGKAWGQIFLPRIGQEVVVSFLEGDPDRPLITGSVYNAEQTVPYTLPDEMTKSTIKSQTSKNGTGKNNEMRFEDKSGSEEVYIHAQKDYQLVVENDVTRTTKHNETTTITNDCTMTINHDNTITVKNNRSRTVSEGNESLTVSKGTRTVSVKGSETHTNNDTFSHTVDKDYTLTVKGNLTIEVTGDLSIKAKSISMKSSSADIGINASTSLSVQSGTSAEIKSGTSMDVKSGTDMTVEGGTNTTVKAGIQLQAKGTMISVKADATGEYDGGGMLTLKGGLVKIN